MKTKIFDVQGMVCDACVGHVTKALRGLNGVQAAEVDLAGAKASVTYDPARVQVSQILEAVADEGYEASI